MKNIQINDMKFTLNSYNLTQIPDETNLAYDDPVIAFLLDNNEFLFYHIERKFRSMTDYYEDVWVNRIKEKFDL